MGDWRRKQTTLLPFHIWRHGQRLVEILFSYQPICVLNPFALQINIQYYLLNTIIMSEFFLFCFVFYIFLKTFLPLTL